MFRRGGLIFLCLVTFFTWHGFARAASANIGISPAQVNVRNAIVGIRRRQHVTLVRSEDIADSFYMDVVMRGDQGMITGESELLFPAGVDRVSYAFFITPQSDAPFSAEIDFLPRVSNMETRFRTGVTFSIQVETSNQRVMRHEIHGFFVEPTEEGMPLIAGFTIHNTGNVPWKPDQIYAKLRTADGVLLKTDQLTGEEIPTIDPDAIQDIHINLGDDILEGEYTVTLEMTDDDGPMTHTIPATVFSQASLVQSGEIISFGMNKSVVVSGALTKVLSVFNNTGEVAYNISLTTEVYRDEGLVDIYRTRPKHLRPGESTELFQLVSGKEPGDYHVVGYVVYGQRTTGTQQATFIVHPVTVQRSINIVLVVLVVLLILFVALYFHVHKKGLHVPSPRIHEPIQVRSLEISGRCHTKDGTDIRVFIDGVLLGSTRLHHGLWFIPVKKNSLFAGGHVTAVACQKKSGRKRICTSDQSQGAVVRS